MDTPRPPAPTKEAMPATETVITTMFRTPARITPAARGSLTRSRV